MNSMLAFYFLFEKNCLYTDFFLSFRSFSKVIVFFIAFSFVFFIFIRIIESIESFDLNHDMKRFDKIFESFLSFNNKISSIFESSLSSNQSDRIYSTTTRKIFRITFSSKTLKKEISTSVIIARKETQGNAKKKL